MEEEQRGDQRQVEQDRRGGVDPEMVQRIEDAAEQRHQADQEQIGEGEAAEHHHERELRVADPLRPAPQQPYDGPRGQLHHQRHHQQHRQQHRLRVLGEGEAVGQTVALGVRDLLVEHRDERRRERPLGKQRAEHVGQAEGDEEGVRREARADKAREQRIAHEAKDAADQCQPADRAERAGKVHARAPPASDR